MRMVGNVLALVRRAPTARRARVAVYRRAYSPAPLSGSSLATPSDTPLPHTHPPPACGSAAAYRERESRYSFGRKSHVGTHESPAKAPPAKHRVRHRKVRQGETIYKKHPSWNLMLNIKLGISYTVARVQTHDGQPLRARVVRHEQ